MNFLAKILGVLLMPAIIGTASVHAQILKPKNSFLKNIMEKAAGKATGSDSLSNSDIVSGLKEALNVGTQNSTGKLSLADGFLKDAAVKILLPPEVQKVEKTLRTFGMGKLADNAITSLNRAAEDASKKAAPIFLSPIKNMSITDALGVLRGGDGSATYYLRKTTGAELSSVFKPVIDASLVKVDATKYWNDLFSAYNKFSAKKVETDLSTYVTQKAMDGIFYYVAQEEKNIRKNPEAYATDILKKVFGGR
ncbi:MAG: DUF4197 domain-containing protein [Chitinophagaceae bacterium]